MTIYKCKSLYGWDIESITSYLIILLSNRWEQREAANQVSVQAIFGARERIFECDMCVRTTQMTFFCSVRWIFYTGVERLATHYGNGIMCVSQNLRASNMLESENKDPEYALKISNKAIYWFNRSCALPMSEWVIRMSKRTGEQKATKTEKLTTR